MDWIEIIQLKSFTFKDNDRAVEAFRQLSTPFSKTEPDMIHLLKSQNMENELSILINWCGEAPQCGKSRLGLQIANAFSEFGYIYHSGWTHCGKLAQKIS